NLLDNACKWARQRVEISAEMTDGGFRLTLEDDGPGCDAAALNRISQRGTRLDEKNPGHGLGLAIAEDIVSQYAGELHFSSSPLGGLAVAVRLPQQG
ncbi:MAG TPA: ATP-binding protein, partial [Gammaproteobacteria bacterium]|nr:ATP-binding protein [Gammaproteobacteria bacterium]